MVPFYLFPCNHVKNIKLLNPLTFLNPNVDLVLDPTVYSRFCIIPNFKNRKTINIPITEILKLVSSILSIGIDFDVKSKINK